MAARAGSGEPRAAVADSSTACSAARSRSARPCGRRPARGADAVGTVLAAIWGFVGGVFGLVTILIVAFYLLSTPTTSCARSCGCFRASERARVKDAFRRAGEKVSAWLAGQLLLGAIIGTTAALGLWIMGVPYFYVLALIAGIGELIPIVGPLLAAIPAVAVAFSVSPTLALGVAIFFFVQQQVENHVSFPRSWSGRWASARSS